MSPVAGSGPGNAGGGSGGPSPADVPQAQLTVGGTTAATGIGPAMTLSTLTRLDGIIWAVPSLALTVPGLLLLLAVLAQIAAGASWVPVVRRKVGGARIVAGGRRSHRDRRS